MAASDTDTAQPRRRGRRIARIVALALAGVVIVGILGVVIWSQVGVMSAEREPLASVTDDPRVEVADVDGSVVMRPTGVDSTVGLVFIPGAKVEAEAYEAKLLEVVAAERVTVVITRPWLNLAFFDPRPLSTFTDTAPDVTTWLVGGHSLGGVRACQLAADADGLVLFASYCATDLSESGPPALSLSGSEDGLTTPAKIDDARALLPADATFIEIPGAAHSSFGDYGAQPGDGDPTVDDTDMTAEITTSVAEFLDGL